MKIGRRRPGEFLRRITDLSNYTALGKMFMVHRNPVKAVFEEVFSLGRYPRTVTIRTPTGSEKVGLFSPADMSTLNLIFCRGDYYMPKGAKVIVDIGSNIGLSALFWLTRNDESYVYCYEPSPVSYERLERNLHTHLNRVSLNRAAVSDFAGMVRLGLEPSGVYSSLDLVSDMSVECKVVHINDVLEKALQRHDSIDVLKVDSEGHEIRTLKAIKPEYWNRIRCVNVDTREAASIIPKEFHHSHVASADRFWRN